MQVQSTQSKTASRDAHMLNTIKTVVEFLYYVILTCKQLRPHSHHNLAIQKMTALMSSVTFY